MVSAHTPGPWTWMRDNYDNNDEFILEPLNVDVFVPDGYINNPRLIGDDGDVVVSAGDGEYTPYHGKTRDVQVANARLIAAAPELLQALAGLVAAKDSVTMGQERELYAEWLPKARAAIAKATGEA